MTTAKLLIGQMPLVVSIVLPIPPVVPPTHRHADENERRTTGRNRFVALAARAARSLAGRRRLFGAEERQ